MGWNVYWVAIATMLCDVVVQTHAEARAMPRSFPAGFKWCVATAAHQIEGGNTESDWWDWETLPGKIKNGDHSGAACDHWNRLEEDTALIKALGVSTYRFSIEWAKIEPAQGRWNLEAVEHYRREIALLQANGIEPMITLQHFTLPRWVRSNGGWGWGRAPEAFARYVRFIYGELANAGTRDWITINEPLVPILGGYVAGIMPPGVKDMKMIEEPVKGLVRAHGLAYRALHEVAQTKGFNVRVGIAHHLRIFDPESPRNPLHRYAASKFDQAFNWAFGEACETGHLKINVPFMVDIDARIPEAAHTQDFIGVNYYTRDLVATRLSEPYVELISNPESKKNDLGWEIYPQGFYRILKAVAEHYPGRPVLITENGIADAADSRRANFIIKHLEQLHQAITEGVPVEAYCHWSLMDNFEWAEGFEPRFGLYEVDYATQRRTPRESARVFERIVRANRLH